MNFWFGFLGGIGVGFLLVLLFSGWFGWVILGIILVIIAASFADWSGEGDGRQQWPDK